MRYFILFCLILALSCFKLNAQTLNSFPISTGYDANYNLVDIDTCWKVIQAPLEFSTTTYRNDGINGNNYVNYGLKDSTLLMGYFISPYSTHYGNSNPKDPIVFERTFCVTGSDSVQLKAELLADNQGAIYFDGKLLKTQINDGSNRNFMYPLLIDTTMYLTSGVHTVQLHLWNWGSWLGIKLSGRISAKDPSSPIILRDGCSQEAECDRTAFDKLFAELNDSNSLIYNGNATMGDASTVICPNGSFNKGSVWYSQIVPVADGFSSTWQFYIDSPEKGDYPDASEPGADGIAFVIQNSNQSLSAIGSYGQGIGYDGIDNALAIEIDLYANTTSKLDPTGNHLAIMGTKPNTVLKSEHNNKYQLDSTSNIPVIIGDGRLYYAKVEYNAKAKALEAWVSTSPEFGEPNLHISNFDIKSYVNLINGTHAYVGFTSATGDARQNHHLYQWAFCPKQTTSISNVDSYNTTSNDIMYPNPASNIIRINLPEEYYEDTKIEIYNMLGQRIYSEQSNVGISEINISNIDEGIYFVMFKSGIYNKTCQLIIRR